MYLVSSQKNKKRYSGSQDEKLFKTLEGAKARVKTVYKLIGKRYYISII